MSPAAAVSRNTQTGPSIMLSLRAGASGKGKKAKESAPDEEGKKDKKSKKKSSKPKSASKKDSDAKPSESPAKVLDPAML